MHTMTPAVRVDHFDRLEATMLDRFPRVDVPVFHHFAAGMYAREMRAARGTFLTGRIHKAEHLSIIAKGRIEVWTEGPDGPCDHRTVTAPAVVVSPAGTRRAGYVHEDVVWITLHLNPDDTQDPETLEHALVFRHDNPLLLSDGAACRG